MMEDDNDNDVHADGSSSSPPPPSFDEEEQGNAVGDIDPTIAAGGGGTGRTSYWKKHKRIVIVGISLVVVVTVAVVLGVTLSNKNEDGRAAVNNAAGNSDVDGTGRPAEKDEGEGESATEPSSSSTSDSTATAPAPTPPAAPPEFRIEDDAFSFVAGTDEAYYMSVLDNDSAGTIDKGGDALGVRSIVKDDGSMEMHGSCGLSIDLKQVVYVLDEEDYVGSDWCSYEACRMVGDEDDGEGKKEEDAGRDEEECKTAVVKITMTKEDDATTITTTVEDDLSATTAASDATGGVALLPVQQLQSNDLPDLIVRDAVVAVHGDIAVVGSASADGYNGAVLVYARDDAAETWTREAKLSPPDGSEVFTYYGWSLDVHEDTIVVGAWGDGDPDEGIFDRGCVHVYVRDYEDGEWTYQAKIVDPDGEPNDHFGNDVAIYEDRIVVGAWQDDVEDKKGGGSAHVFVRGYDGGDDVATWTRQARLVAPDGTSKDAFGNSVDIYGDTVAIGAWKDDYTHLGGQMNGTDSGSVHIFVSDADGGGGGGDDEGMVTWTHQAKLMDIVGEAEDWFGNRVAIHGDTVVVGARGDDNDEENNGGGGVDSGSVYIYARNSGGEEWTREARLVAPDGAAGDMFGNSVAVYGDTIVVGSRWDDDSGTDSGSAHVYVRRDDGKAGNSDGGWTHQAKLLGPDGGEKGDYFGFSVGIYEGAIVVGSKSGDVNLFSDDYLLE